MKKKRSKFRTQLEKQTKANIIKTWLTSLSMTIGVVFLVVVFIPQSPKAIFIQVSSFHNEVYYQVHISDEDHALIENTAKIVLNNQLENYEQAISLGHSMGAFENLNANTRYSLSVMANKGFGYEIIASTYIHTKPNQGGVIANYYILDSDEPYFLDYAVDVKIFDTENEYNEVFLYVNKIYQSSLLNYDFSSFDETYPIFTNYEQIKLETIYKENIQYHLVLVAILTNGETKVLDEVYFYTPFNPYAYFYVEYVSDQEFSFSFYHAYERQVQVIYEIVLIEQNRTIRKYKFQSDLNEAYKQEEGLIENLKPETTYEIKVFASYIDPDTKLKIEVQVYHEEITTIRKFDYSVLWIESGIYYEISVIIQDPHDQFDYVFFEAVQQLSDGTNTYHQNGTIHITDEGQEKTIVFNIVKEHDYPLEIIIRLRVKDQFSNRIIIEVIRILPKGD